MTPRLPVGCVIALLGAESTGKTELARAICCRLRERGIPAALVGDSLREWCDREGRTPLPDERTGIATEQTRRIEAAAAQGVVVADTTALMMAVYSDMLFDDRSLYAGALAAQRQYAITLLAALDLPWAANGLQRDGAHLREPVDALVRAALGRAGLAYAVIHGEGSARLSGAWNAIHSISDSAGTADDPARRSPPNLAWSWPCEKCSDSTCEHRLFSDLLAQRRSSATDLPKP